MAGYNQSQPNTLITASAPTNVNDPATGQGAKFAPTLVNRVLGRVDAVGSINTTTALTDAYNGDNIRSAVSSNGQQFWTSGNVSGGSQNATGGVRSAALGGTTSTQVAGSTSAPLTTSNINKVDIYNGQLYAASRNASNNGIWQIGTGTPTTAATPTRLFDYNALVSAAFPGRSPGNTMLTNFQGPYDFFFANDSTVYVADSILGITKFTKNGGAWQYGYTFARTGGLQNDGTNGQAKQAGGATGLAGRVLSTGGVVLFGTGGFGGRLVNGSLDAYGGNYLFSLLDTGTNPLVDALADITILDVAAANEHFKGVALAPMATTVIPVPPAVVLMLGGMGLLGAFGWKRRKPALV